MTMNFENKNSSRVRSSTQKMNSQGTIEKSGKSGILKMNLQFFASENFKTIKLPKKEYAKVMSEFNTHMSDEQRKQKVVTKAIGDYFYTIENNGFDDYRIIDKYAIDSDATEWWDE